MFVLFGTNYLSSGFSSYSYFVGYFSTYSQANLKRIKLFVELSDKGENINSDDFFIKEIVEGQIYDYTFSNS